MSAITDILGQLPLGELAEQVGASEKETKTASTHVIKSLLGGMTANAQESSGEQSLASALTQHLFAGQSFASNGVDLNQIDTKDGSKIVKHALGASTTKTAEALAVKTGTDKTLLQKLLPILAPIVLAYIANKALSGNSNTGSSGGDLVGSLVGGLLGGGSSSSPDLGSMVGGLLGGGGSNSGGLGSMLGGLLGGALEDKSQATKAQQSSGGVLGGLLDAIF